MVLKELFLIWDSLVVLKELIFNSFYFQAQSGGFERTDYEQLVLQAGGCAGIERTDFEQFLHWDSVEVLKELILTVDTLRGCGGLKVADF